MALNAVRKDHRFSQFTPLINRSQAQPYRVNRYVSAECALINIH